jgi:hypothetical protein
MKRDIIVGQLIKEGFSEKTLVRFSDKQLSSLASRILSEQQVKGAVIMKKTSSPQDVKKITDMGTNVELREKKSTVKEVLKGGQKKLDKNHNGKIDAQDFKILKGQKKSEVKEDGKWIQKAIHPSKEGSLKKSLGVKKDEKIPVSKLKSATKKSGKIGQRARLALTLRKLNEYSDAQEWVEGIVENNYHSLTTKNEIMELIKSKLTESDVMENQPATKPAPSTNPSPTVDPNRPKPQKPKRENPFEPGRQPKPKAKTNIPDFMKFDNIGIKLKESK